MIEQGIVSLIQSNATVAALCPAGGFLAMLPANQALPSWTHATIGQTNGYTLQGPESLTMRRMQINCFGTTATEAMKLANAITKALDGYRGTLADPDATVVQANFADNVIDIFDADPRSYRRSLDFQIWFEQMK